MKSVLMSIQPKWCELIASGKKTVEVRKTKPKLEVPFKVYIYCTQARKPIRDNGRILIYEDDLALTNRWGRGKKVENPCGAMMDGEFFLNGKVIGEFVCNALTYIEAGYDTNGNKHLYNTAFIEHRMCISDNELHEYLYKSRENSGGWAWHISNLVIYDKPKELGEFLIDCKNCGKRYVGDSTCWQGCMNGYRKLTRPPQSWCYVEGGGENA